jgi:predicted nucleotidyltransferase
VIPPKIKKEIVTRLDEVEAVEGVRILLAVESGSRAWGFPSADSDYDVRFIYIRPRDWYLSIDLEHHKDVIERPILDEIDLSGWDARKALKLFRKSNPPLMEWLQSPIIYRENSKLANQLRRLLVTDYSPRSSLHHYWHMAQGNFREYLRGDAVWRKKYFYVLRPLLAILWIENGYGPVPMAFADLVESTVTDKTLRLAINELIAIKKSGGESERGPKIPAISEFIEAQVERLENLPVDQIPENKPTADLSELFRTTLQEVWESV